jgi:hypothetical protein
MAVDGFGDRQIRASEEDQNYPRGEQLSFLQVHCLYLSLQENRP